MLMEDLPFCKCGCGERVAKAKNKFIRGHSSRMPEHRKHIQVAAKKMWSDPDTKRRIIENKIKTYLKRHGVTHPMQIPEAREKLSKSLTGRIRSEEHCQNISKAAKGRVITEETKRKMSAAHSGKCFSEEHRKKIGSALKNRKFSDKTRKKMSISAKRKIFSEKHRKNIGIASKRNFLNADFLSRYHEAINIRPNNAELKLQKMLDRYFPGDYKYVGDFEFVLGGRCPDFLNVNGQKKLIELFGDYWHSKKKTGRTEENEMKKRKNHFRKYGFETLVIWEKELKSKNRVVIKIKEFDQC